MPLDRRALRGELQRARGFVPPSRRAVTAQLYDGCISDALTLCLIWMSGEEALRLKVSSCDTVAQIRRAFEKSLASQCVGCRYRLLCPERGMLDDKKTLKALGFDSSTASEDHITLQVVADRSLTWHRTVKGCNAAISKDGRIASRTHSFYEAIVFCSQPSRSCRVRIVEVEICWSGSLELGFSALPPEELSFNRSTGNISAVSMAIGSSTGEPWHAFLESGSVVEWRLESDYSIRVRIEGRRETWLIYPQNSKFKRKMAKDVIKVHEVYPFAGIYGVTQAIELLGIDD